MSDDEDPPVGKGGWKVSISGFADGARGLGNRVKDEGSASFQRMKGNVEEVVDRNLDKIRSIIATYFEASRDLAIDASMTFLKDGDFVAHLARNSYVFLPMPVRFIVSEDKFVRLMSENRLHILAVVESRFPPDDEAVAQLRAIIADEEEVRAVRALSAVPEGEMVDALVVLDREREGEGEERA